MPHSKSDNTLRLLIREQVKSIEKNAGAGIVVVKNIDGKWKVLGLQLYGRLDIPKGKIEKGENPLAAAVRETEEEASITELNFKWGLEALSIYGKAHLTIYLAETTQEAAIQRNPETGIYEHHGVVWLDWDAMEEKIYGYLAPAIAWARNKIES